MKHLFRKIQAWLWSLRHYVILDPADNSVTLSRLLFRDMQKRAVEGAAAQVFVFRVPDKHSFGFMVSPPIDEPTQLCDIQYNERYRCVGFETLCPSVGRIFYDLGLPYAARCKLSVSLCRTPEGRVYYLLIPPRAYAKSHR